ncbi:hypothetical protein IFU39_19065 [Paenibacillus sp. CFBP 13594]|uniref:hypothetical protein n=1 Tax=Paenibacillus sp. CFBP 13594 TaxID=2774037 RepID=UPI00177C600C|nr:hypothetical protein [Paenibacillus sp. CFBP 13594]MBD8839918.1 hypothetical protein [Paenibacillus sp. CFBP 13594]
MTSKESEQEKLARKLSMLQEQHLNAITKMSIMINQSSISRMVEQISLSSKINSQYSQAWKAHQGLASSIQQVSLAWNEPLAEIAKITSSPSFSSAIKGINAANSIGIANLQTFYKSPSFVSMIDAISNMDTHSWQSFVDTVPEDISSNINDIEQEIESDPETKANFEPYIKSIEEVLSSHVGAKVDLSKSKLTITGLKILIHLIITLVGMYGPQILLPDPTDDLVEETKRHNIVEEKYQRDDLELKQKQIEIDQEQVKVSKDILSELKKSNEQKKDSK